MEESQLEHRLKRIERKVQILVALAAVQTGLLVVLVIWSVAASLVPNTPTLILILLLLGAVVYIFRRHVPRWLGNFSRMLFAQLLSAQEPDSLKDSLK